MLNLGALAFASPWPLLALVALPLLWWLLRFTPPAPRRERFPAIALLLNLKPRSEEPARTPLWLLILRGTIALLIILGLAEPIINPPAERFGTRPLLLVVDDGWSAAAHWAERRAAMMSLVEEMARHGKAITLVTTAPRVYPPAIAQQAPATVRGRIEALEPSPWAPDRKGTLARLAALEPNARMDVVWLSDGLDYGDGASFAKGLAKFGTLNVVAPQPAAMPLLLAPPDVAADSIGVSVRRADANLPLQGRVRARAGDGRVLGESRFAFATGAREARTKLALPLELRNAIARLEIAGERSAGAVQLLDESDRRRSVGLVSGAGGEVQPLLSDLYFLERALEPYAEVTKGSLDELVAAKRSVIVLADVGELTGTTRATLAAWVEAGGVLVRFAGPRLAAHGDDLLPVALRQGGRTLGGALSWEEPQALSAFEPSSPFHGLELSKEVTVSRQVLAEPAPDLAQRTWARLADGTPLVTAAPRGRGLIVLFHVTANPDWSNLPLSGLYVDMLRKIMSFAHQVRPIGMGGNAQNAIAAAAREQRFDPQVTLDAFGAPGTPPPETLPLTREETEKPQIGPRHPPGLYGLADGAIALNVGRADSALAPLPPMPAGVLEGALGTLHALALKPWLLLLAALLLLADAAIALGLAGAFSRLQALMPRLRRASLGALLATALLAPIDARAAGESSANDAFALEATSVFRLAYVRTGNGDVDSMSEAGLAGLSQALTERTAVEPATPLGVDLETDELAFFPLLYWRVTKDQPPLSDKALKKLSQFMSGGGTLFIDTADQDQAIPAAPGAPGIGPGQARLREILSQLDLPPLEPVPADHVLTKSFYLMHDFPGRSVGGALWVEATRGSAGPSGADHDGVAALIVGSNDWASAWARDASGRPMAPVMPGGERQREQAVRFGINLVMYALTGNYKADQVHVPALLERLGQ
jgi:hypothetical protein